MRGVALNFRGVARGRIDGDENAAGIGAVMRAHGMDDARCRIPGHGLILVLCAFSEGLVKPSALPSGAKAPLFALLLYGMAEAMPLTERELESEFP
jgi:hypothetical protein